MADDADEQVKCNIFTPDFDRHTKCIYAYFLTKPFMEFAYISDFQQYILQSREIHVGEDYVLTVLIITIF